MEKLQIEGQRATTLGDPVRIDDVRSYPDHHTLNAAIEKPVAPSSEPTYSILIQGWALGGQKPVQFVELSAKRGDILRVPVDRDRPDLTKAFPDVPWAGSAGFRVNRGALNLPREFRLHLYAAFEDGTRSAIGEISGERRALPSMPEDGFQPILVTTIGRTGSTWLTWVLSHHPELIAYGAWDYEPRVTIYFSEMLAALSQPFSYRQLISGDMYGPLWWIGTERTFADYVKDPEFERYLGTSYLEDLARVLLGRVEPIYGRIAEIEGKPDARFFVEKQQPSSLVQDMIWDAFPGTREIFLVRDFRDVVCSILAYGRKRGAASFGREFVATDEEFISGPFRTTVTELHGAWKRRSQDAYLLRYEDLLREPEATLDSLLSYLGVDTSAATVERVLADSERKVAQQDEHRTAPSVEASIGRWKTDLSPELQQVCWRELSTFLEAFGYES
jgi:hypothetical protein